MESNVQEPRAKTAEGTGSRLHRMVIVGGGAGGLELATRLGDFARRSREIEVVLVDRSPTHLWKPLLHEVAAGSMDANAHQLEYAAQARWHTFEFQQGDLAGLDRERKTITIAPVNDEDGAELLPSRELAYDTLVLAIGSVTNFFNVTGAAQYAMALDAVPQAEHFRRKLIAACMRAQSRLAAGAAGERQSVDIVIVGGGATGVELSAELRGTAETLGAYGIHRLDPSRDIRITLVEAGPRILPPLPERIAIETVRLLNRLNIEVLTGDGVAEVRKDEVVTASGKRIASDLTVWAGGIRVASVLESVGLPVNKIGQVIVNQSLQSILDPDIFALGDCASCPWPQTGKSVPPRAQAAHQQASFLYKALRGQLQGKPMPSFQYHDHGSLVSLGRFDALGNLMGRVVGQSMRVEGAIARLLYVSLYRMHLMALHGFSRMALDTVAQWLRQKTAPRVKLH